MNISFLKSLMGQTPDQTSIPGVTGTVHAFPEDMIFEENLAGKEMPFSSKGAPSLSEIRGMESLDTDEVLSVDMESGQRPALIDGGNRPDEFVNNILATVDLSNSAGQKIPKSVNGSSIGIINLSEIDPSAKILPYVNVRDGQAQGSADLPRETETQPKAAGNSVAQPKPESADSESGRSEPVDDNASRIKNANQSEMNMTAAKSGEARAHRDPGPSDTRGVHLNHDGQIKGLNRAAFAVEQARPAETHFNANPINLPAQLIQKLNQLHAVSARSIRGQVDKPDLLDDAVTIPPASSKMPLADEAAEQFQISGLSATLRQKRLPVSDTTSTFSSVHMKELSSSSGRTPEIAAARPGAHISAESTLDFDAHFIDNLAREIGNIAQSKGIARFSLRPEHLGRVDVEIRGGEQGYEIKLTAETEAVRQILVQSQSKLEQEARLHGHRLSGVEIGANLNQSHDRGTQDSTRSEQKAGSNSDHPQESDARQRRHGPHSEKPDSNARFA